MKITTILTTHRTGSWYLGNTLDNKDCLFLGEVLNPNDLSLKDKFENYKKIKECFVKKNNELLVDQLPPGKKYIIKIIGTLDINKKTFYESWKQQILNIIQLSDSIIINYRHNLLEQYISLIKALKLKEWSKTDTSNLQINFLLEDFLIYRNIFLQHYGFYLDNTKNKKTIKLCYEDIHLQKNKKEYLNNIIKYIDLEAIEKNRYNKQQKDLIVYYGNIPEESEFTIKL
jgi:hypothetical protein